MRVNYDPEKSQEIIVDEGSTLNEGSCEVFGCVISEEEWDSGSGAIGREIVSARDHYESTIDKLGAFTSHLSLHPKCIREGNIIGIGFADNLSVNYPFRVKNVNIPTSDNMGFIDAKVQLEIQPCFGGGVKEIEYNYTYRFTDEPSLSDQVNGGTLFNPNCKEKNQVADLDCRAMYVLEDNHLLFAADQAEDIVAHTV